MTVTAGTYAVPIMAGGTRAFRTADAFAAVSAAAIVRQFVRDTPGGADVWDRAESRVGALALPIVAGGEWGTPRDLLAAILDEVGAWAVTADGDPVRVQLAAAVHGAAAVFLVAGAVEAVTA